MAHVRHFDLCIIGSGSGNSLIDESVDGLSIALVDKGTFGGTCLNVGCIPTKMFVHPADLASSPERSARLGVRLAREAVDWPGVRDRIFTRVDAISAGGEDWRRQADNVTLYRDRGRFTGPRTFTAGEETFTADRFVIAAGSRVVVPPVPGLEQQWFDGSAPGERPGWAHTSDTVMRLPALPEAVVIVGGGYVAAEFAHVFAAFGVDVTVVLRSEWMLRTEDVDVSRRFTELMAGRVRLVTGRNLAEVRPDADGAGATAVLDDGTEHHAPVLLLATGRRSNADTLGLDSASIAVDERGSVLVDEYQRATADGVFALGDVSSDYQLKHVANHEMRVVKHNLAHPEAMIRADHRFVPHAVFSEPQVAAVGLTEQQARDAGHDVTVAVQEYGSIAYGWALEDESHFAKVVADRDTGQLLGAHLIGPEASVLIQPLIQAMSFGLGARQMATGQYWIHPAMTELVENALLALDL